MALLFFNYERPYCQICWLFGKRDTQQNEWIDGVPGTPKNYGDKIKSHEKTTAHHTACNAFGQWKTVQQIDREHQKTIEKETSQITYWRQVLHRIINIILTQATMSLAFRGHRDCVGNDSCYEGNFLALVAMQARFDLILQDLLCTPKYLNLQIQNELILLISNRVREQLIS